jgi:hypothetical protein
MGLLTADEVCFRYEQGEVLGDKSGGVMRKNEGVR